MRVGLLSLEEQNSSLINRFASVVVVLDMESVNDNDNNNDRDNEGSICFRFI